MTNNPLASSELILNEDGSIYHLHLKPDDIAHTIITVGDPDRVADVTKYFDTIEVNIHRREFTTHTGTYKGKRLTVISTGIGTDNIDIVLNELDALVNIDFESRTIKQEHTTLDIIRIGTSGGIQPEIPLDSFIVSEKAIGLDALLHFYHDVNFLDSNMAESFMKHMIWNKHKSSPYVVSADPTLQRLFSGAPFTSGITATNVGFYGPQGRTLRLKIEDHHLNEKLQSFRYKNQAITNLEMETSGIYGMATLLGHRAISLNAILANRATGRFSETPKQTIHTLIVTTLDLLAHE